VSIHINDDVLYICDSNTGEVIGEHKISHEEGVSVKDRTHTRDRSKGIPEYKRSVAKKFDNHLLAIQFLDKVHDYYPRYIRDQLQLINRMWDKYSHELINESLVRCVEQQLYSATEFRDMVKFLITQEPVLPEETPEKDIQPLHSESSEVLDIKLPVRDISIYTSIMGGGDPS